MDSNHFRGLSEAFIVIIISKSNTNPKASNNEIILNGKDYDEK
jgi:hypothetical protein